MEPGIPTGPPRKIDPYIDLESEAREARKLAHAQGVIDEQELRRFGLAAIAAVSKDMKTGDLLYDVPGRPTPVRGAEGRRALVNHLRAQQRLAAQGGDPSLFVAKRLEAIGYSRADIDAAMRTDRPRRAPTGEILWRNRSGGDELVTAAAEQLVKKLDEALRLRAISKEALAEMAERHGGMSI